MGKVEPLQAQRYGFFGNMQEGVQKKCWCKKDGASTVSTINGNAAEIMQFNLVSLHLSLSGVENEVEMRLF